MFAPLAGAAAATSAAPEVHRAGIPAWVQPVDVETLIRQAPPSGGADDRLLVDRQVNAAEATRYLHVATRFLTATGVEDGSRVSITFDPSYESVTMHQLIVHRDGKAIDRLAGQEIKVLQREERLDWHLYDGRLSAEIILEDIRVGDVLEYAFSIHGWNPIFGGHFVDEFYTDRDQPVHHLRNRLLWPSDRHLEFKNFGAEVSPTITANGQLTEYVWERRDLPAVIADGQTPKWFDPWSWIEFTEFDSWAAVAHWANGIYTVPTTIPDELEMECQRIAQMGSDEAKVVAALRYVQDNIRYLGMEIGVNSHQPYPIETILTRRFGDCKDKALLLCTMLRRLGFEAHPSLVGTDYRQTISDWLPSPMAFNHLVVQLNLHGANYWLDPTRQNQGGMLDQLYFPDYGWSLVIAPGTTALARVKSSAHPEAAREVSEAFDVPDFNGTATLRVRTIWRGLEADKTRAQLAATTREEIRKNRLNDYAQMYPNVETVEAPRFQDDRDKNVIVSDEKYRLTKLWETDEKRADRLEATFGSDLIRDLVERPATRVRTSPYALSHPRKVIHTIEVNVPRELTLDDEQTTVDNPAFHFNYSAHGAQKRLTLQYAFESRSDHVAAEGTAKFLEDVERTHDHLSYELSVPRDWAGSGGAARQTFATKEIPPIPSARWAVWLWVGIMAGVGVVIYFANRTTPSVAGGGAALHRCAVCGETEESNPALDFRVAANGLDYCRQHLPARSAGAK